MRCEKCGKEKPDATKLIINGEPMQICRECTAQLKDIRSFGYKQQISGTSDANAKHKIRIQFRITHPEYFGNADKATVEYHYELENQLSYEQWQKRAKIDIIAPVLQLRRDSDLNYIAIIEGYLENEKSVYHGLAHKYFDCLVPIDGETAIVNPAWLNEATE